MKKTIAWICILLAFTVLTGCSKEKAQPAATESPAPTEAPSVTTEPVPVETAAPQSSTLSVTDEQSVSGESYSVFSDSDAVFSVEEGRLTLTGCSFDQTGTESGSSADGTLIFQNGGTLTLSDCTVSSEADLTTAIENCAGEAEISGSVLLLSGGNSVFFSLTDEASLAVSNSMLSLSGTDETAFSLSDSRLSIKNGSVTSPEKGEAAVAQLTESSMTAEDSSLEGDVIARYGTCGITLAGSDWSGTFFAFDEAESADLRLKDLSSFTGSIPDGSECVNVTLDAVSHISLTDDSYVAVISDEDASFQNISGNGFNLYYNGELEENAALASGTYALKDGGYLIPLI